MIRKECILFMFQDRSPKNEKEDLYLENQKRFLHELRKRKRQNCHILEYQNRKRICMIAVNIFTIKES